MWAGTTFHICRNLHAGATERGDAWKLNARQHVSSVPLGGDDSSQTATIESVTARAFRAVDGDLASMAFRILLPRFVDHRLVLG